MAIEASDIKVYLTGLAVDGVNYDGADPQSNPNLSLGGFRSSTEINGSSALSASVSSADTAIQVDDVGALPGASAINPSYAVIGEEMVSYTARSTSLGSGYILGVTRGVFGRIAAAHSTGDIITGVTSQNLFDHVRASENASGDTEYRCFAVLNTNSSDTAFNVKVFMAPIKHEGLATAAAADSGSGGTISDSTIIGSYSDNFFNSGTIEITGGAGLSATASENIYTITDYVNSTGTFVISGNWNNGVPNTSTTFVAKARKASPNPNTTMSFAIERHFYSKLDGSGVATGGGSTYMIDSTLPGNGWTSPLHFVGAYIIMLTGDGVDGIPKRISGYNSTTGRIDISGNFVNAGVASGDLYAIVRGPTENLVSGEGVAPPIGVGNLSSFTEAYSVDEALSIDVNDIGEDLVHDELFFIWLKREVTANTSSYYNDNVIPSIYFEI